MKVNFANRDGSPPRVRLSSPICWSTVLLALLSQGARAEGPSNCEERLRSLAALCGHYARDHGGKMPASLADLYYNAYADDFEVFRCPGRLVPILGRDEIDAKGGYVLSPGAQGSGPRPLLQDRSAENHGGRGIHVVTSDGAVSWRAAPAPSSVTEMTVQFGQRDIWGARMRTLPAGDAALAGLPTRHGIRVEEVRPGGVAASWGLEKDDILASLGGRPVKDLPAAVAAAEPAAHVPLLVFRNGKHMVLLVELGELQALLQSDPAATTKMREGPEEDLREIGMGAGAWVGEAGLCQGLDSERKPAGSGSRFSATLPRVVWCIDHAGAPPWTRLRVEWYREAARCAEGLVLIEGCGCVLAGLSAPPGSTLPPGRYRAAGSVGGKEVVAADFEVVEGGAAPAVASGSAAPGKGRQEAADPAAPAVSQMGLPAPVKTGPAARGLPAERPPSRTPTAGLPDVPRPPGEGLSPRRPAPRREAGRAEPPAVRTSADALAAEGDRLLGAGKVEEALALYERALKLAPSSAKAVKGAGRAKMLLGDLQGASTALSLYASTTLSDPEAMVLLADCAMASGDRARARQWLQWGIQRSPEHASAHALMGTLEGMEGRQKEANECFARAAKLDAGVAVKRCENGEILARVGQHQRALWEYVAALSIDPGHSPAYLGLGSSFAALGEGERAVESYLYYLRFDVTSPLADQARREIERLSSKPSGQ